MPHFAHRRIESDSGEERSLDLGSQSHHHWNDFTGELYQASIKQVSSSESSTSSVPSSITKKSDLSPDSLDKLLYANADDFQPTIVKKPRKRAARRTDFEFDTAAERRSYFGSAEHRQAIQFGLEVRGLPPIVPAFY